MKSGETGIVAITCNGVVSKEVDKVIFTLIGAKTLTKTSSLGEVLIREGGIFEILLQQEDTIGLSGGSERTILIEGQIVFKNKSVAKTLVTNLLMQKTLATEIIENNSPDPTQLNSVKINMATAIATMDFSALDSIIEDKIHEIGGTGGTGGQDGKSAYESALDGGYEGTEEEFNAAFRDINMTKEQMLAILEGGEQ